MIQLIHWKREEAQQRVTELRRLGLKAVWREFGPEELKRLRAEPPDALIIDLTRLPSQGREIGNALRQQKTTRLVPLIFAGGAPEKVSRVRDLLPDAIFTAWKDVGNAVQQALQAPPQRPVVPASAMAAYAGVPLHRKLGIKPNQKLALVSPPPNWSEILGELPSGTKPRLRRIGENELVIWFAGSRSEITARLEQVKKALAAHSALWIAWPKRASGRKSDLTQQIVREAGLAAGLVDYKICSIDAIWSALLFTWRKK